jgi:hypothetical protein
MNIVTGTILYRDGTTQVTQLMRLLGVNSGDTIDLGAVGGYLYSKVQSACFSACGLQQAGVATVAGTVVTLTLAGMALETVNLLSVGE